MAETPMTSFATAIVSATPVVDIDGTAFLQAGLFFGLMIVLNGVLFRPWLATLERRNEAIGGSLLKAKALRADADELAETYDQRIADSRDRAAELRSTARRDEEAQQATRLANVRHEASAELDAARARVRDEAAAARDALSARIDALAEDISAKVLGRAS